MDQCYIPDAFVSAVVTEACLAVDSTIGNVFGVLVIVALTKAKATIAKVNVFFGKITTQSLSGHVDKGFNLQRSINP